MKKAINTIYDLMFDMFDYWDGNVNNMLKTLSLSIPDNTDFSKSTDQIQTNFRGFYEKVCITDQHYFYRPLCHHCNTRKSNSSFQKFFL